MRLDERLSGRLRARAWAAIVPLALSVICVVGGTTAPAHAWGTSPTAPVTLPSLLPGGVPAPVSLAPEAVFPSAPLAPLGVAARASVAAVAFYGAYKITSIGLHWVDPTDYGWAVRTSTACAMPSEAQADYNHDGYRHWIRGIDHVHGVADPVAADSDAVEVGDCAGAGGTVLAVSATLLHYGYPAVFKHGDWATDQAQTTQNCNAVMPDGSYERRAEWADAGVFFTWTTPTYCVAYNEYLRTHQQPPGSCSNPTAPTDLCELSLGRGARSCDQALCAQWPADADQGTPAYACSWGQRPVGLVECRDAFSDAGKFPEGPRVQLIAQRLRDPAKTRQAQEITEARAIDLARECVVLEQRAGLNRPEDATGECDTLPIFEPGGDNPMTTEVDWNAMTKGDYARPVVPHPELFKLTKRAESIARQWWSPTDERCPYPYQNPPDQNCQDYPFRSTEEAGNITTVSLERVNALQNSSEGGLLEGFYALSGCSIQSGDSFLVLPIMNPDDPSKPTMDTPPYTPVTGWAC